MDWDWKQTTVWRHRHERMGTQWGDIPYEIWLNMEAQRLRGDGPRRFQVHTKERGKYVALFEGERVEVA